MGRLFSLAEGPFPAISQRDFRYLCAKGLKHFSFRGHERFLELVPASSSVIISKCRSNLTFNLSRGRIAYHNSYTARILSLTQMNDQILGAGGCSDRGYIFRYTPKTRKPRRYVATPTLLSIHINFKYRVLYATSSFLFHEYHNIFDKLYINLYTWVFSCARKIASRSSIGKAIHQFARGIIARGICAPIKISPISRSRLSS